MGGQKQNSSRISESIQLLTASTIFFQNRMEKQDYGNLDPYLGNTFPLLTKVVM